MIGVCGIANADEYVWQLPPGLRPPQVPADNPMSVAKVAFGERLFFDGRLSVTGAYSCASCHDPALAFTDGRVTAIGATGEHHTRNTPTLINVAYAASFGWSDPSLTTLEAQHRVPMYFLPEKFTAAQARDIGLVSRVFEAARLRDEVGAIAARLAAAPPHALREMKRNFLDAERLEFGTYIGVETERHVKVMAHSDAKEAFKAFAEKRAPRFGG